MKGRGKWTLLRTELIPDDPDHWLVWWKVEFYHSTGRACLNLYRFPIGRTWIEDDYRNFKISAQAVDPVTMNYIGPWRES